MYKETTNLLAFPLGFLIAALVMMFYKQADQY
jgi:hypothetical protein